MNTWHLAYLLLGSNIQPVDNLRRAASLVDSIFPIQRLSNAWETPAVGAGGPNFLNAALLVHVPGNPAWLAQKVLRPLEARLGRVRTADKNAPRTIDLDIIVWDEQVIDQAFSHCAHIAVPLAEIAPDFWPTHGERLRQTAARLVRTAQIRLRPEVFGNQALIAVPDFIAYPAVSAEPLRTG